MRLRAGRPGQATARQLAVRICPTLGAAFLLILGCAALRQGQARAVTPVPIEDVVFATDGASHSSPGCNQISVIDARSGRLIAHGEYRCSPGRLTARSDGLLVLSGYNAGESTVRILAQRPADPGR